MCFELKISDNMIDKINNTNDNCLCYRSPKVSVIVVNAQSVLCLSGEYDVTGNDPIIEPEE